MDIKRPGVYIEEIALLPPSVVGVSTAVPAFLGYTEKGDPLVPKRISSMLEFIDNFGGPPPLAYRVDVTGDQPVIEDSDTAGRKFFLYYTLQLFFQYGDSPCYIISTGHFRDTNDALIQNLDPDAFYQALAALEKEDEPTLIVFPEAREFTLPADFYTLCDKALNQCERLKDRFVIIDVMQKQDVETSQNDFRDGIGNSNLKYGAAYFPNLDTVLRYIFDEEKVSIDNGIKEHKTGPKGLRIAYQTADNPTLQPEVEIKANADLIEAEETAGQLLIEGVGDGVPITSVNLMQGTEFQLVPLNELGILSEAIEKAGCFLIDSDQANTALAVLNTIGGATLSFQTGTSIDFETDNTTVENLMITLQENVVATALEIRESWINKISDASQDFDPLHFDLGYLNDGSEIIPSTATAPASPESVFKTPDNGLLLRYIGSETDPSVTVKRFSLVEEDTDPVKPKLIINGVGQAFPAWGIDLALGKSTQQFHIEKIKDGSELVSPTPGAVALSFGSLAAYKTLETAKYNQVINLLRAQTGKGLPPSGAVAGIYAKVDRERGVWKAPANVSITGVVGPSLKITDAEQDDLNVHAEGGKSINAIRNFTGKGTLIWGARTLAGNDNEWRYIPVRRLFNMIEESTKKATEVFVFEPNDATTWTKVKGMIESYLFGLWQRGALAGPTPESAYFVNVGLGKTMSPQDILEGRMIVEIGIAAVRPAEFIILRFSHKMQEAA